ncbi:MAG: glycosyltransferase family 39 protein [Deltaproteobacteria bacterium]|nr:glycosyltransferase family 39 protein [Deltaproteobacteria bacterium]
MQEASGKIIILFVVPVILYIALLPFIPLMEPDESRYSSIPSAMNNSGDYVTPRLKGAVYFEKPPLVYWATALSFLVFGENEFSSRLAAGLAAWGCILLVYYMGAFLHGERTGLYAAAVLTTTLYHFALGRINILDMPLAFFVSFAIWAGFRHVSGGIGTKKWVYLLYVFSALAFLTKGLIGIVFPFAIITIWLFFSRQVRKVRLLFSPGGILIFLAVSLPWLILVQAANEEFFRLFFIQEHLLRYTTTIHYRNEPFYYYLPVLVAGTMPWCAFLPQAVKKTARGALFDARGKSFLITWIGFILLFFSFPSSKLVPYIAPVFLPLAIFMGKIFKNYDEQGTREFAGECPAKHGMIYLPIMLQAGLFIIVLLLPPFLKTHRIPLGEWWPWVVLSIFLQIAAVVVPGIVRSRTGKGWFLSIYVIVVLFLGSLLLPLSHFLTPYKTAYPVVQALKSHLPAGRELYQYGMSLYGIDFYGKMRTPVVNDIGEVKWGSERLPREERAHYFLTSEEFFRLFQEKEDIYCVTNRKEKVEELRKEAPGLRIVWDNGEFYLIHLLKGGTRS